MTQRSRPVTIQFPLFVFYLPEDTISRSFTENIFFIVTLMKPGLRLIASGHFFFIYQRYISVIIFSSLVSEGRPTSFKQDALLKVGFRVSFSLLITLITQTTNQALISLLYFFTATKHTSVALTCRPMGPGGPGKPRAPSSPFCPNIPCWPLGPGSPSAPWKEKSVAAL